MVSERSERIEPSATLRVSNLVKKMRQEGKEVISLSVGEPDYETFEEIKKAAIKALNDGKTGYTAGTGIPSLKSAVREKFENENGIKTDEGKIIVTMGGKYSIYLICQSIINERDKAGIFDPAWVSYLPNERLAGAEVEWIDTDENCKPDIEDFKKKAPDLELIIINSPNNPTGGVYSKKLIQDIVEIAEEHDVFVMSDEVYEKLLYEGTHYSPASDYSDIITINSFP